MSGEDKNDLKEVKIATNSRRGVREYLGFIAVAYVFLAILMGLMKDEASPLIAFMIGCTPSLVIAIAIVSFMHKNEEDTSLRREGLVFVFIGGIVLILAAVISILNWQHLFIPLPVVQANALILLGCMTGGIAGYMFIPWKMNKKEESNKEN